METIFDRDPDANVSLASFGAGGQLDADFGLDLAGLQTIVEGYEDRAYEWGTNHSGGLLQPMAIGGGDWGYDNKIVVFMTDGQYNPGADGIDEATTLRSNDFDVFSILLVPQDLPPLNINRLSAYMNGLSSSYCGCFNVGDPVGICGGSHGNRANNSVQCASEEAPNEYDYFEECDDGNLINGDGCDSNMQWEDTNKKRAYRAVDIDGVLNMYDAIAASLPVNDAQIRFIGGFDFMDDDGIFELPALSDVPTEVIIDSFNYCPW